MQQTFMKTKPILPPVLSMSLPMVVSMMVASLYNIVDSYYVAKISEDAMTALSLVFPVQNLSYFSRPLPVRLCLSKDTFDAGITRKMYGVGIPAALNLALPSLLTSCLNMILSAIRRSAFRF